ncbi:MAG: hypothetical protein ACLQVY_23130, partial [Limisphaerales bacterium]
MIESLMEETAQAQSTSMLGSASCLDSSTVSAAGVVKLLDNGERAAQPVSNPQPPWRSSWPAAPFQRREADGASRIKRSTPVWRRRSSWLAV